MPCVGTSELAVLQQRWCLGFHSAVSATCLGKASESQRCYNLSVLAISSRRLKNYSSWAKSMVHVLGNPSPCFLPLRAIITKLCSSVLCVRAKLVVVRVLLPIWVWSSLFLCFCYLFYLLGLTLCLMPRLEKQNIGTGWRKGKISPIRLRDHLESVQVWVKACFPCRFSGG